MKRVNQVTKLGGKSEMISQIKQQGFTIVELLIVIVVIAILAALSYVGYTSITARANNSTIAATVKAVKDAAQVYQGANGSLPTTAQQFREGGTDPVAKLPTDIVFINTTMTNALTDAQAVTGTAAPKSVVVIPCSTTGFRIFYKDFTSSTAKQSDVGTCASAPAGGTASIQ